MGIFFVEYRYVYLILPNIWTLPSNSMVFSSVSRFQKRSDVVTKLGKKPLPFLLLRMTKALKKITLKKTPPSWHRKFVVFTQVLFIFELSSSSLSYITLSPSLPLSPLTPLVLTNLIWWWIIYLQTKNAAKVQDNTSWVLRTGLTNA
jgi:hypothetical protein